MRAPTVLLSRSLSVRDDAEVVEGLMGHTGGYRHAHRVVEQGLTRAEALAARLGPGFTASTARRTGAVNGNRERHIEAVMCLPPREREFGGEHIVTRHFAQESVAHAFDDTAGRRKIDRDLVGETILRHDRYDTDGNRRCQGCVSVWNALWRRSKNVRCAAGQCSCMKARARHRCRAPRARRSRRAGSGSAPIAITLRKPEKRTESRCAAFSARRS